MLVAGPDNTPDPLSSAALDALAQSALDAMDEPSFTEGAAVGGRALTHYHAAAAVLSTFDKEKIRPFSEGDSYGFVASDDRKDALLADCRLVRGSDGGERWSLLLDVRRAALSRLGDVATLQRAIDANAQDKPPNDAAQEMFELYLHNRAPRMQDQTSQQVAGTEQVLEWLDGLGVAASLSLPTLQGVRNRSSFLALIQPFYTIAGEYFAGREREMAQLREYVGVMPPDSVGARVQRFAAEFFKLLDKPPLLIWGPGGRGKSTLVSRFVWEHATLPFAERFPWAYLDFDRPGLIAEEPLTLLIEALRQLGIQYPVARTSCESLRQSWSRQLSDRSLDFRRLMNKSISVEDSANAARLSTREDHDRWLRDFAQLLSLFTQEREPFLFVLDTFERVQYRSEVVVSSLWEFLELFQERVPRLRTVIAGRSPLPPSLSLPRSEIQLEDFDEPAALMLLGKLGVKDEAQARAVFAAVGGNALSLRLAAEVLQREGTFEASPARRLLGFFLRDNTIQAQLFARILSHIHNPDVRKLAYPGMVLRRITADIIRQVLAAPSRVDVPDAQTAERLFAEMAREVALVTPEGDTLLQREDVRRLVIRALRAENPSKVREVEEAAIAYYASRSDVRLLGPAHLLIERAEEIYHRLSLQHPLEEVAARWLEGVARYLVSALD